MMFKERNTFQEYIKRGETRKERGGRAKRKIEVRGKANPEILRMKNRKKFPVGWNRKSSF